MVDEGADDVRMKAVITKQTGDASGLVYEDAPRPVAGPHHVLVRVRACAVAFRDVIERRGGNPILRPPIIQGHEFAGEVVEVGDEVSRWREGDHVICLYTDSCGACTQCLEGDERRCGRITEAYGLTVDGGYAEYARVHERGLERLAEGLSFEAGACMLSAVGVGYHNVRHKAAVQRGEVVLVTGASGGVGSAALQTARLLGAVPWAITSSEEKTPRLRALGAEEVIVDPGSAFHREVRRRRPEGVDAVIDCVGSPTLGSSLKSTRRYGRVVAVGNVDPAPVALPVGQLVVNAIDLLGSDNVTRSSLREAMTHVLEGRIEVVIDRTLPLARAAEAHVELERRGAVGRIVLIP
jgi:D-arabinose 1-dehydrogenase-like Zn-dependent alcohol dehydrogenase